MYNSYLYGRMLPAAVIFISIMTYLNRTNCKAIIIVIIVSSSIITMFMQTVYVKMSRLHLEVHFFSFA